jgi:hypothetical protein
LTVRGGPLPSFDPQQSTLPSAPRFEANTPHVLKEPTLIEENLFVWIAFGNFISCVLAFQQYTFPFWSKAHALDKPTDTAVNFTFSLSEDTRRPAIFAILDDPDVPLKQTNSARVLTPHVPKPPVDSIGTPCPETPLLCA